MQKQRFSRFLAAFLSVLILAQSLCLTAFATDDPVTVIIPAGSDKATVNQILTEALLGEVQDTVEWEYNCEGKANLLTNEAWGSIEGFTSETKGFFGKPTYYTHPALANNVDSQYKVRVAKTTGPEYTILKKAKLDAPITLAEGKEVALNTGDLKSAIFNAVVQVGEGLSLSANDVTIKYQITSHIWSDVSNLTKEGTYTIQVSWGGNATYSSYEAAVEVEIVSGLQTSSVILNEDVTVGLVYGADSTLDCDATKEAIFGAVVASITPELEAKDVTVEYYATATTGAAGDLGKAWMPLGGGKDTLTYPAISAGKQQIRISWSGNDKYKGFSEETTVTMIGRTEAPITLAEGKEVALNTGDLKSAIFNAVVQVGEGLSLSAEDVSIRYQAKNWIGQTTWTDVADLKDTGTYTIQVSWVGNATYSSYEDTVEVEIVSGLLESSIQLRSDASVALVYNEASVLDIDQTKQAIFEAVVESIEPAELRKDNVTITYYATATVSDRVQAWMPLGGGTKDAFTYPAISAGEQQIRISWSGSEEYEGFSAETTVKMTDRTEAPYKLKNPIDQVKLVYQEDMTVDYSALRTAIFNAVVAQSDVLTAGNVTITYYATATTGAVGSLGKAWMPLAGGKDTLTYPAISAGEQQIRISWPGNSKYAPTTIETTVTVADREALQFNLKKGPYEVGLVFNAQQGYDYAATAAEIFNAVVDSTSPIEVTADDVTVEYNASLTGLTSNYKPLNNTDTATKKFGEGAWSIKISWAGNQQYAGNSVTVSVMMSDSRLASAIVLKEGVSFTYNKDVAVMKQAILDSVIDWESSTLPARETLSIDDFTFTYNAQLSLLDGATGDVADSIVDKILGNESVQTAYVPFEGKSFDALGQTWGSYPPIGAGEQQIRVSYNGNADYKPSAEADGTVTINKASVKVTVKSTSMYVSDAQNGLNLVTTDPEDDFDLYVLYAGITSNVTTGIYLELPARYTSNSTFMKIVDKVLEGLGQPTLTQMMQEGITVGQLRELLNATEVIEALEKLGLDTGSFGQIITVINKLPSIGDNIRVAFGIPNQAGIYTVAAITDNSNYNTGVGMGALVLKADKAKLVWNQNIGSKLTAAEAKSTDFGATLMINGMAVEDQSSVHVLYSGFTSKWKVYSSTTTPPTEAGRYVMTVCILGGNYLASPITRSFQITK